MFNQTIMKITAENKTDYLETHFEVVQTILWTLNNERQLLECDRLCKEMRSLYQHHGRGALWTLAENITDAFMKENEHRVWDGEWGEEVVNFTEKWLFKTLFQSTPEQIKEFIDEYCTLVSDTDDNDTELYMDNHKCIVYDNKQYYLPEDISFSGRDAEIYDLLIDDYQYS